MAFGLIQWIASFIIFLVILTVITWSAVHLGEKDQNVTDIRVRFFDTDYYPIQEEDKPCSIATVRKLTSPVIKNITDSTLFANDQGSEVPDSAEIHRIFQTLHATLNRTANSVEDENATSIFHSTTAMLYHRSDRLNNHGNMHEKILKPPNHILQAAHPTMHQVKSFDVDRSRKSDSYRTAATYNSEFLQNNETSSTIRGLHFATSIASGDVTGYNSTAGNKRLRHLIK